MTENIMKTNKYSWIMLFLMAVIFVSSCNKKDYLDSGIHDPIYNGTTMQFLESRPELFDSLIRIIKIADLEQVINKPEMTFFAPANVTINKSIYQLNRQLYLLGQDTVKDLSQVDPKVWKKFLSRYILDGKYLLKDFPQLDTLNLDIYPGQGYTSYAEEPVNIGVLYNDVVSKNSAGVEQVIKYAGYRQLYISYVYNFSNESTATNFINAPVATSDLQTSTGVLHVLNFSKHNFGFNAYEFSSTAYSTGIKPASK